MQRSEYHGGNIVDQIKTLIHFHTDYSYDSNISVDELLDFAKRENFGCLAVTDHDTIEGAKRLQSMTDIKVIVGEEVTTSDGHLIGLFLEEHIKPGMSARDTARAIREQGGLVFLPHPFVRAFSCGVGKKSWDMVDLVDAVEINNAQNFIGWPDYLATKFATQTGLTAYVGSDSHMTMSIAPCYQTMRDFNGPADFLDALRTAQLHTGRHSLSFFAATGYRIIRHMLGLKLGGNFGSNYLRMRAAGEVHSPVARPSIAA